MRRGRIDGNGGESFHATLYRMKRKEAVALGGLHDLDSLFF
jgi:hypothetical protein